MGFVLHDVTQGSEEWLKLRKNKITASMIPAIRGESEHETPLQLFNRLINGEEIQSNFAMERGHQVEGDVREWLAARNNLFFPVVATKADEPFLLASLDGWNLETVLEIKYVGKKVFEECKETGKYPQKFKGQLQMQLYVMGAKKGKIAIQGPYKNAEEIDPLIFEFEADEKYQQETLRLVYDFNRRLIDLDSPKTSDGDIEDISAPDALDKAERCVELDRIIKASEKELDSLKEEILTDYKGRKVKIGKILVSRTNRKGSIDFARMKKEGIDVEAYRKSGSEFWSVKISLT